MQCEYNNIEGFLESLPINPKYFEGYKIVSHILEMEKLSKGGSI